MVRYKNRYLLLNWHFSPGTAGCKALEKNGIKGLANFFKEAIAACHGDYGLACVQHSLSVKYMNSSTMITVLRCPRAHCVAVQFAISCITSYNGEPCAVSVLHIGGTIRAVQQALAKRNKKCIERRRQ